MKQNLVIPFICLGVSQLSPCFIHLPFVFVLQAHSSACHIIYHLLQIWYSHKIPRIQIMRELSVDRNTTTSSFRAMFAQFSANENTISGRTCLLRGISNQRVLKESHSDAAYKGIPLFLSVPIDFFLALFLSFIRSHRSSGSYRCGRTYQK